MKKILHMGNPSLYKRAEEIQDPSNPIIQETVKKMMETLEETGTFIGLAAPQIGIFLRIVVFRIPKDPPNPRYKLTPEYDPDGVPLTTLVNPKIEYLSDEKVVGFETCLSLPGMMGIVERYKSIRYTWQTPEGKQTRIAHGFHARVVQHECDHLDGILYPMRIKDIKNFGFIEEIQARNIT